MIENSSLATYDANRYQRILLIVRTANSRARVNSDLLLRLACALASAPMATGRTVALASASFRNDIVALGRRVASKTADGPPIEKAGE